MEKHVAQPALNVDAAKPTAACGEKIAAVAGTPYESTVKRRLAQMLGDITPENLHSEINSGGAIGNESF